jgi:hypothetical protein
MEREMAENDNLRIWNSVEKTSPSATKPFNTGTFKGTAISVMHNARRATEMWGPVGIGWGYEIIEEKLISDAVGNVTILQVRLRLWYKDGENTGEVFHYGATKLAYTSAKDRRIVDEDAAKKAVTDALGKCLSLLGFSADVYLGKHDDQAYVNSLLRGNGEEPDSRPAVVDRIALGAKVVALAGLQGKARNQWNDQDRACLRDLIESLCHEARIPVCPLMKDIPEKDIGAFCATVEHKEALANA